MTPTLFDSHAHLDLPPLAADVPGVLGRARAAGVHHVMAIGVVRSAADVDAAPTLAAQHPGVYATAGIHPHDASRASPELLAALARTCAAPGVLAVGETGLDYHYLYSPAEAQQAAFRAQLRLARTVGKPVVLHLRLAHADALAILREENARDLGGIVHCFSGDVAEARDHLDLGLHISFSGIVTFPRAEGVRAAARFVPADRLLVETDAPYLAPVPFRGRPNEPAHVVHTARVLSELRGVPVDEIARVTTANARSVYRISEPTSPGSASDPRGDGRESRQSSVVS
jgi:TatD DNase family protein